MLTPSLGKTQASSAALACRTIDKELFQLGGSFLMFGRYDMPRNRVALCYIDTISGDRVQGACQVD
ncbi:MAG: hypothetical protein C7B44_15595 [Sulfobacillus thermosulfidooxidans]|nr:MAG: hypothetical protein C7B44_15595 [Sulfobacillus thermosulfidooxidans]